MKYDVNSSVEEMVMSEGSTVQPQPTPMWYQALKDVIQFLMAVLLTVTTYLSAHNANKVQTIERQQTEVADRQEDAAVKAEAVKKKLDEKAAEDAKTQGITLFSTWRYLEDVAFATGSERDKAAAADAKKLYAQHIAKYGSPKP